MAINKPTIDAGPAFTRERAQTVVVGTTSVKPPGQRFFADPETNALVSDDQAPEREGQMLVFRDGSSFLVTLMVVVNIGGTLTWVECNTNFTPTDSRTGKAWNPDTGFFSYLAN